MLGGEKKVDVAFERRREPDGPDRPRKKQTLCGIGDSSSCATSCLRRSNLKLGDLTLRRKMSCDVQELAGDACAADTGFGTHAHANVKSRLSQSRPGGDQKLL